jgi:myosin-crossreactive antigen
MSETAEVIEVNNRPNKNRVISDGDVMKYEHMVDSWIRNSVLKNWNNVNMSKRCIDMAIGNTGMTVADFRQYLMCEVVVALRNFNPNKGAKESTFVYGHLFNRIGQLCKKLVKKSSGYGIWVSNIQEVLHEIDSE